MPVLMLVFPQGLDPMGQMHLLGRSGKALSLLTLSVVFLHKILPG
jgi:hypothetical protein